MSEGSKKLLHYYHNQATEKEIKNALAWAQNYELDSSINRSKSPYMIGSLVYLYETAVGAPNTIGKALCELFFFFKEDEAKNVLNRFRFSIASIYHVLEHWRRGSDIPVVFNVKLLSEAYNVMHYAAFMDDLDMVKWLLELNINVDKEDSEGRTALHVAAGTGKKHIIHCLLNFGASLFSWDKERHTPLEAALLNEQFEVVEFLKPDLFCNLRMSDGETLLMKLIRNDQEPQVKHMLRYANFNVLNFFGQNVLHLCALSRKATLIGTLLKEIPSEMINAKDVFNQTPLHLAKCLKQFKMIEELLAAGAEITPEMRYLNDIRDITDLLQ